MRRCSALLLLAALTACGKRGDPLPPRRIVPQPVSELRLSQRGDQLETSFVTPRAATDGSRLGVLEIELTRTSREGDFDKLAERQVRRAAPGEALRESEPLPPAGTTVRVAARALSKGRASSRNGPVTLVVQPPPLAPQRLTAEVAPSGVALSWVDPNPVPTPTPTPSATPTPSPTPTPSRTPAPAVSPSSPLVAGPAPAPASPAVAAPGASPPVPSPSGPVSAAPLRAPTPPPTPPPPTRGVLVYRRAKDGAYARPLQPGVVTTASFVDVAVAPGEEWCYVARFAASLEPLIESAASAEACATFKDIAPPATPIGVALVVQAGAVEVSWSPSPEPDLAGYRVYRAAPSDAPAERLAELPPGQTSFRDTNARSGILSAYTVTAYDKAGNESPPSAAVQARP